MTTCNCDECHPELHYGPQDDEIPPHAWSAQLMCFFHGWRVLSGTALALDMPPLNYCDMSGAIKLAGEILPGVLTIKTFAGGVLDTEYRYLEPGTWEAFPHD